MYANCVPVKGAKKAVIMDLGRKELYEVSNEYIDLILRFENEIVKDVLKDYSQSEVEECIIPFITFIIDNELGHLVTNTQEFPRIDFSYSDYSKISNAIIDIKDIEHDIGAIFTDLDELGVRELQVRFYRTTSISELSRIAEAAKGTSFYSIEIICFYDEKLSVSLKDFLLENPVFTSLTFSNSRKNIIENIFADEETETLLISKVIYTKQKILSCKDCGIINLRNMVVPNVQDMSEYKHFNSCLNKKLSIDIDGKLRNCPSINQDYGSYGDVSLIELVDSDRFKSLWRVKKDDVLVCQDCEYRYICTDCRAFVKDSIKDKPLKCNYNPYLGMWEN